MSSIITCKRITTPTFEVLSLRESRKKSEQRRKRKEKKNNALANSIFADISCYIFATFKRTYKTVLLDSLILETNVDILQVTIFAQSLCLQSTQINFKNVVIEFFCELRNWRK